MNRREAAGLTPTRRLALDLLVDAGAASTTSASTSPKRSEHALPRINRTVARWLIDRRWALWGTYGIVITPLGRAAHAALGPAELTAPRRYALEILARCGEARSYDASYEPGRVIHWRVADWLIKNGYAKTVRLGARHGEWVALTPAGIDLCTKIGIEVRRDNATPTTITVRQLPSGWWHIKGHGPENWAQPPRWPCDEATLREHAFPQASEAFIAAAVRLAAIESETGRVET